MGVVGDGASVVDFKSAETESSAASATTGVPKNDAKRPSGAKGSSSVATSASSDGLTASARVAETLSFIVGETSRAYRYRFSHCTSQEVL